MKQVYMPSQEGLYIMQDRGINIYKYLLIKAIESIIMDAKVYKNDGTRILENLYKYLREDPYIVYSICRMYPEEIPYSDIAKNDTSLCLNLISPENKQDNSIYNLDNLSYFEDGLCVLSNRLVIDNTIKTLIEKLPSSPRYRFEYRQNQLLDDIFNCELDSIFITTPMIELAKIDPAYILRYNDQELDSLFTSKENKKHMLNELVNLYGKRYGIPLYDCNYYKNQDILTNPEPEVKRLLKCINQRKIKR